MLTDAEPSFLVKAERRFHVRGLHDRCFVDLHFAFGPIPVAYHNAPSEDFRGEYISPALPAGRTRLTVRSDGREMAVLVRAGATTEVVVEYP